MADEKGRRLVNNPSGSEGTSDADYTPEVNVATPEQIAESTKVQENAGRGEALGPIDEPNIKVELIGEHAGFSHTTRQVDPVTGEPVDGESNRKEGR